MLEQFEGYRLEWYGDPGGVQTIGYGHTGPLPEGFHVPLTAATASALLRHDLASFESAVRALDVHLTTQQGDALCDFAYNCGPGALQGSIKSALHRGDYAAIPGLLAEWVHDEIDGRMVVLEGLVTRRRAEGELFAHGIYPEE